MRVTHEQCPRCAEGLRDKGRDNLARYPDGGAYCFSCGYVERARHYKPRAELDQSPPSDLTRTLPSENRDWLDKYINTAERGHFWYSPKLDRHVYKCGEYWEARSVNRHPKVISGGNKPFNLLGKGDTIVIVEDIVSAIKVSRVARSLALFGSHCPSEWMVKILQENPTRVFVWLDEDKALESRKFSSKINTLRNISKPITTSKDPKEYTSSEIERILRDASTS